MGKHEREAWRRKGGGQAIGSEARGNDDKVCTVRIMESKQPEEKIGTQSW